LVGSGTGVGASVGAGVGAGVTTALGVQAERISPTMSTVYKKGIRCMGATSGGIGINGKPAADEGLKTTSIRRPVFDIVYLL